MVTFFLGFGDDAPKGECEDWRVWHSGLAAARAALSLTVDVNGKRARCKLLDDTAHCAIVSTWLFFDDC